LNSTFFYFTMFSSNLCSKFFNWSSYFNHSKKM